MMLAESRSRLKWSDDPRNTRWANDKSKFGYTMLTKMGWTEGKGLGEKLTGDVSHIKVKKRCTNAGIGMKKSSNDDWIAHQDSFNALLAQLNQGVTLNDASTKVTTSLEQRVRTSRKKILYTKFVKSKDLSNASEQDLACIFGTRSQPATPQLSDNDGVTSDSSLVGEPVESTDHGVITVRTGVSVSEYFAKKMATLKQNKSRVSSDKEEEEKEGKDGKGGYLPATDRAELEIIKKKKEKKRKNDDVDCSHTRKKKKRQKSTNEEESSCVIDMTSQDNAITIEDDVEVTNVTSSVINLDSEEEEDDDLVEIRVNLKRTNGKEKRQRKGSRKSLDCEIIECVANCTRDKKRNSETSKLKKKRKSEM